MGSAFNLPHWISGFRLPRAAQLVTIRPQLGMQGTDPRAAGRAAQRCRRFPSPGSPDARAAAAFSQACCPLGRCPLLPCIGWYQVCAPNHASSRLRKWRGAGGCGGAPRGPPQVWFGKGTGLTGQLEPMHGSSMGLVARPGSWLSAGKLHESGRSRDGGGVLPALCCNMQQADGPPLMPSCTANLIQRRAQSYMRARASSAQPTASSRR